MIMREVQQRASFGILTQTRLQSQEMQPQTWRSKQEKLWLKQETQFKTMVPLNRFSFFEELANHPLLPMNLEFEIELQNDAKLIWQNDGTNRRIVVRKI